MNNKPPHSRDFSREFDGLEILNKLNLMKRRLHDERDFKLCCRNQKATDV